MHWSPNVVLVQKYPEPCAECKVECQKCMRNSSSSLEQEFDQVKLKLNDSYGRMLVMEEEFLAARKSIETENNRLVTEIEELQESYERLLESHRKLQKLNDTLETKLINLSLLQGLKNLDTDRIRILAEKYERDKNKLNENISTINARLLDARVVICDLEDDLERCRSDCNVAVQLLRCRPSQFIEHKLDSLPIHIQRRIFGSTSAFETRSRPSDQPTSIVYSVNQSNVVPLTAIAHVLTQPVLKPRPGRVVVCSGCHENKVVCDKRAQTEESGFSVDRTSQTFEQVSVADSGQSKGF